MLTGPRREEQPGYTTSPADRFNELGLCVSRCHGDPRSEILAGPRLTLEALEREKQGRFAVIAWAGLRSNLQRRAP